MRRERGRGADGQGVDAKLVESAVHHVDQEGLPDQDGLVPRREQEERGEAAVVVDGEKEEAAGEVLRELAVGVVLHSVLGLRTSEDAPRCSLEAAASAPAVEESGEHRSGNSRWHPILQTAKAIQPDGRHNPV